MPFASLACGSLLCVFCPGAHRHRAGIKTTVPNAEEIRIAHNLAYSQARLVTSIDGGVLNRFWGTHPLAYARGSLTLAESTRLLPSRDRQGAVSSEIPKTFKHQAQGPEPEPPMTVATLKVDAAARSFVLDRFQRLCTACGNCAGPSFF